MVYYTIIELYEWKYKQKNYIIFNYNDDSNNFYN